MTQDEVLLEAKRGGLGGQRRAVDQSGAGLGQVAFILVGMKAVERLGDHRLQNGITKKFHPLVVIGRF